jgi:hypothetical protein
LGVNIYWKIRVGVQFVISNFDRRQNEIYSFVRRFLVILPIFNTKIGSLRNKEEDCATLQTLAIISRLSTSSAP